MDSNNCLRPQFLKEYIGQEDIVNNLKVYIEASKKREEILDHILLYGPPGLGKTTLANIIANELNSSIKEISAPSIEKIGELASILCRLSPGDILFIDEIHALDSSLEEILYSAMEDYKLNIIIGKDQEAKQYSVKLPPFVLIGATTKISMISNPLRDRFGIVEKLDYYDENDLSKIAKSISIKFDFKTDKNACDIIANISRGTPRILINIMKRIRDYIIVENIDEINDENIWKILDKIGIDQNGLNKDDKRYISILYNIFNGGPVGIENFSKSFGDSPKNIESIIEPFLIKNGLIIRKSKGRVLSSKGLELAKSFLK